MTGIDQTSLSRTTTLKLFGYHPVVIIVAVLLLFMPLIANDFILYQIFSWSFMLGIVALSLMFLAGYGGMVSLAQMTIAGFAGYMVAIFGVNGIASVSIGWPWWLFFHILTIHIFLLYHTTLT